MKLYIIGNGFDLFHDMNTGYYDFRDFARNNNREVFNNIDDYAPAGDEWNDLEASLGEVDFHSILENHSHYLKPYSAVDYSADDDHNYAYFVNEVAESLTAELLSCFCSWLELIKIPDKDSEKKFTGLSSNDLFLTFNYTSTLQTLYNIQESRVKHIHGAILNSGPIVLGHGWESDGSVNVSAGIMQDPRESNAYDAIDRMFENNFKNCVKNINDEKAYFTSLNSISEVIIIGHSLADVDSAYFKEVLKNIQPDAIWCYALRKDSQNEERTKCLIELGVSENNIKNVLITVL